MEIDAEALMNQAKQMVADVAGANFVLAGRLAASEKKNAALEAEIAELKKAKEE